LLDKLKALQSLYPRNRYDAETLTGFLCREIIEASGKGNTLRSPDREQFGSKRVRNYDEQSGRGCCQCEKVGLAWVRAVWDDRRGGEGTYWVDGIIRRGIRWVDGT
jgi:hypothetical protein